MATRTRMVIKSNDDDRRKNQDKALNLFRRMFNDHYSNYEDYYDTYKSAIQDYGVFIRDYFALLVHVIIRDEDASTSYDLYYTPISARMIRIVNKADINKK